MSALGPRFVDALGYTAELHADQRRKGDAGIPYVGHLLGVCALVVEDGGDEDEAIGALLHDAVEDQGGLEQLAVIRERYGARVALIVEECTDADGVPKPPWADRKRAYLASLPDRSPSGLRVSNADKLFNAGAILRDHGELGPKVWDRFTGSPESTLGYYEALAAAFQRLRPGPLATELRRTVDLLTTESGLVPLPPERW